jgi:hypothetical protein
MIIAAGGDQEKRSIPLFLTAFEVDRPWIPLSAAGRDTD